MKGVKRLTPSSYETGDFITTVPDDHVFAGKDLQNGRGEELLGDLSETENEKLLMEDEQISQRSGAGQLAGFRSLMTGGRNLKVLHRRKYNFADGVKIKPNAQVAD